MAYFTPRRPPSLSFVAVGIVLVMLAALILLAPESPQLKQAQTVYAKAERHAASHSREARMAMRKAGRWIVMKTPKDHLTRQGRWLAQVSEVDSVLMVKGQFIRVAVTYGAASRDAAALRTFFFYPDGKLAAALLRYSRIDFGGQQIMTWYSRDGRQLKRLETSMDTEGEPSSARAPRDVVQEAGLAKAVIPMTYSRMPVSSLFKAPVQPGGSKG